jgi:hypothetical protein
MPALAAVSSEATSVEAASSLLAAPAPGAAGGWAEASDEALVEGLASAVAAVGCAASCVCAG